MTQRLKVVPSSVAYDIAGDYFQALRHITAYQRLTACECFWTGEGLTAAPAAR